MYGSQVVIVDMELTEAVMPLYGIYIALHQTHLLLCTGIVLYYEVEVLGYLNL